MCLDKQETQEEIELRLKIAELSAGLGENIDDQLHEIADAAGDDLSGNDNTFVPWSDPLIPYECGCGAIIYSDSDHSHGDEE
jgi:hypothetical protein